MKTFKTVFALLFTVSVLALSTYAQAGASKIGVVDTEAFEDEKAGITRVVNAIRALNLEFQPTENELATIQTKLQGLQREIQTLAEALERGNPPVDRKTLNDKQEEFEKLLAEGQSKSEQYQQRVQQRRAAVLGPIYQEVRSALNDYAKQKGYAVILGSQAVLGLADDKMDVTKDFIIYFNARPAPAAPAPAR